MHVNTITTMSDSKGRGTGVAQPRSFMTDRATDRVSRIMGQDKWRPKGFESALFVTVVAITALNMMIVAPV